MASAERIPDVVQATDEIDTATRLVHCIFLATAGLSTYERDAIQCVLNHVSDRLAAARVALFPDEDPVLGKKICNEIND